MIPMNVLQQTLKSGSPDGGLPIQGKGDLKSPVSATGDDALFEQALKDRIKQDAGKGADDRIAILQNPTSLPAPAHEALPIPVRDASASPLEAPVKGPVPEVAAGGVARASKTAFMQDARDARAEQDSGVRDPGKVLEAVNGPAFSALQPAQLEGEAPVVTPVRKQVMAATGSKTVTNPDSIMRREDVPASASGMAGMAGMAGLTDPRIADLLSNRELDVHEFEMKEGASARGMKELPVAQKEQAQALPSRVSTEDFLSLRGVREKKAGKTAPEMKTAGAAGFALVPGKLHLGPTLEAPVTQGTAGRNILSHDALNQISHQVNLLSKAKQDGEIKIRLKPDHLGELMMNVKTNGQHVTLEIKAQDHESKRIIEESLGRLKDSLATRSLDLGKVEVVAQAPSGQGVDSGIQMDLGQQNRGFQGGQSGQESGFQRESRQEFLFDEAPRSGNLESMRAGRSIRSSGTGTLDLIA